MHARNTGTIYGGNIHETLPESANIIEVASMKQSLAFRAFQEDFDYIVRRHIECFKLLQCTSEKLVLCPRNMWKHVRGMIIFAVNVCTSVFTGAHQPFAFSAYSRFLLLLLMARFWQRRKCLLLSLQQQPPPHLQVCELAQEL